MNFLLIAIGALLLIGLAIAALPYAIGIAVIVFLLWLTYTYWQIAIPCWIALCIVGYFYQKKEKERIALWKATKPEPIEEAKIFQSVVQSTTDTIKNDVNEDKEYIFLNTDINTLPYGRANAFLNFYNRSIHDTNIIYFSIKRSKDRNELREYGTMITDCGIFISCQLDERENDIFKTKDIFIPFSGLDKVEGNENSLTISCIDQKEPELVSYEIDKKDTSLNLLEVKTLCMQIINNNIPSILYHQAIISYTTDADFDADAYLDEKFEGIKNISEMQTASANAGMMGANVNFNIRYNENKNLMSGSRGHGYAAEYGNNTMDRLSGKDVTNAAQQLDANGRQIKNGPDRIVDGEAIQTKYYKTAGESIGAAFEHGHPKYLTADGKMMPIEVPSDQYSQALEVMQKRIDKGQVPGAHPGDSPDPYVRKGAFTYNQAFNIAKAGTIDSLKVDIVEGFISSSYACGISAALVFATCIWNGLSAKDAFKVSLSSSIKTMGKSVMLYTLTMQLSRSQIANIFVQNFTKDGIRAGFQGIENPVASISNALAKRISESALSKTSLGEVLGLKALTGRALISGTIIGAVVFGPDLVRALRGRISKRQLFKNSTVGASGLAGAAIGQAVVPIPVVGAVIGATAAALGSKKVLDQFIDDDAVEMFQIFKEEFLESAMLYSLSKKEFQHFVDETLMHKNLQKMFQDMHASGNPRDYARNSIMNPIRETILCNRKVIETPLEQYIEEEIIQPALAS